MTNRKPLHIIEYIRIIAIVALLAGCDTAAPSSAKIIADLQGAIGEAQERLNELAPDSEDVQKAAAKEVGRLYAVEYKVVVVDPALSAAALEQQLTALGAERWECGQSFRAADEMRIICRRLPLSYLKLLAQFTRMM